MPEETPGITLKDVVEFRIRGKDLAEEGSVQRAAWEVFQWMRNDAYKRKLDGYKHEGRDGWRWGGDIRQPFIELGPAGQSLIEGMNRDAARQVTVKFLQDTGNLVILNRGQEEGKGRAGNPSLWWGPLDYSEEIPGLEEEPAEDAPQEQETAPAAVSLAPEDQEKSYPCREPGCSRSARTSTLRNYHEDAYHPTSRWRVYECTLGVACDEGPYYDWPRLGTHVSRKHGVKNGSPEFRTFKAQAEREAEARRTRLPAVKPVPVTALWEEPSARKTPAPVVTPPFSRSGPPEMTPQEATVILSSIQPAPAPAPVPAPAPALSASWDGSFATLGVFIDNMQTEFRRLQQRNTQLEQENAQLRGQLANTSSRDTLRELREYLTAVLEILEKEGISDS